MIPRLHADDPVRRRIEALGTTLTLPTVRKALGVIEGEHASQRRGGVDDIMDIRVYEPGDEARQIDWRTSARVGRPMVVQRERASTSRVWLLLDVGREMTGACPSGERAYEVAANALRMFAALSLRRSDDISLVFGDAASITRIPFTGGFAQFGRALDDALDRPWANPRNIDALLDYARRIGDRQALVVLATDEHAVQERHLRAIRRIARTHPMVFIDVATLNPFEPRAAGRVLDGAGDRRVPAFLIDRRATDEHAVQERHLRAIRRIARTHPMVFIDVATLNPFEPRAAGRVLDGAGDRRVPAFLIDRRAADEVATHRAYMAAALERELTRCGSRIIRASSSELMFDAFVRMVSLALSRSTRNQLRAAPAIALREAR